MSNKFGLMLSLVIFLEAILIIFDLYTVQLINTELVIGSNYVNSLILKEGGVDDEIKQYVHEVMNGEIYLDSNNYPGPGESLTYTIVVNYKRIYSSSIQKMSISRSVLFGYTLNLKEAK